VGSSRSVCGLDGAGVATCVRDLSSPFLERVSADASSVSTEQGDWCWATRDGEVSCDGWRPWVDVDALAGSVSVQLVSLQACGLDGNGAGRCARRGIDDEALPDPGWLAGPWRELASGDNEVCGVRVDGQVRCSGETSLPDGLHGLSMSVWEDGVACGLDDDGHAQCVGGNVDEQVPDVAFSSLSIGISNVCGVTAPAGELLCWEWARSANR
jgi:hypothetical protein